MKILLVILGCLATILTVFFTGSSDSFEQLFRRSSHMYADSSNESSKVNKPLASSADTFPLYPDRSAQGYPTINGITFWTSTSAQMIKAWGTPDSQHMEFQEMANDSSLVLTYGKSEFSFLPAADGQNCFVDFIILDSIFTILPSNMRVGNRRPKEEKEDFLWELNCDCYFYTILREDSTINSIHVWVNW